MYIYIYIYIYIFKYIHTRYISWNGTTQTDQELMRASPVPVGEGGFTEVLS